MADWQSLDPEAAREAEKYDNPIPSRELILQRLADRGEPAAREELAAEFGLYEEDQIEALRRRLRAMERDGQLIYTRRGTYAPVDKLDLICGRVSGHRDGFGFLIPDDGSDDLFLSPSQMRLVFDGDRALARVSGLDRRGRREGVLVEVISRGHESVVGRYFEEGGIGYVTPDNPKIQQEVLVTAGRNGGAKIGQFVEIKITHWPTPRFQPQGDVVEVIGNYMAPGMEIDVALRSYDIPHVWPQDVIKEARKFRSDVEEKDKEKRIDLRHLPFVTIDGEDARDFDDAVYCEPLGKLRLFSGGWRLYVAIADVSSYVRLGSALDVEAQQRGNSVYFPERVVPMLPEELSNGLCSLNPHVDRLAMVCEMTMNKAGQMVDYQFYEGVIHSHARLTYNKVSSMLEHARTREGKALREEYQEVLPDLKNLYNLYKVLLDARHARGAIDFETQETRIIFGEERKIAEIRPTVRNDAHKLIEECMLAANVATAEFLNKHGVPALYRVHDGPPPERLEKLRAFLGELGLSLHKGKDPSPKDYQALLASIAGRPDFHLIQTVMLRSLSQAVYSTDNNGHFGLNYEAYTHFTSPIRRYPDLLVHRAIRSIIRSKVDTPHVKRAGAMSIPKARIYPYDVNTLDQLGEQCSMTERRADEATRDVVNWLKCEFMKDRVGETFPGVITAVTGFGLFVELTDIYVEGLVHVSALPGDYYHFDPVHHRLSGERTGRSFRLGDTIEVKVMRVDLDERKIDFEVSDQQLAAPIGRKGRGAAPAAEKAEQQPVVEAKATPKPRSRKSETAEAYFPKDAVQRNAEVRKSREMKKALMTDARTGGNAGSKSDKGGKPSGKPTKHRKGPPKSGAPRKEQEQVMSQLEKIYGVHAVQALLQHHPKRVKQIWLSEGRSEPRIQALLALAAENRVQVGQAERRELDAWVEGVHQGVVAEVSPSQVWGELMLEELLERTETPPLILVLDGVTDPHNLGACLRTADAAGATAVVVPKDKSATLTPVVRKVACGAAEVIPLVAVTNLARTLEKLQQRGLWVVGTAGEAEQEIYQQDLTGPLVMIMGAEGKGMRRLTREHCDFLVKLPMSGSVSSLNVSVATGVCLFEAVRQRQAKR